MKGKGREKSRSFLIMGYIYKITNDVNDKVYIGQTHLTLQDRWRTHKYAHKKENYPLYRAMRKYGMDRFHIELVEECSDEALDEREVYWIEQYGSFGKGYNATMGGEGHKTYTEEEVRMLWDKGYRVKEIADELNADPATVRSRLETYEPYKEHHKERYRESYINRKGSKAVKQYTLDGEYIATFPSIAEAERQTGVNKAAITVVCQGKTKTAKGYQWRYEDDNSQVKPARRYNYHLLLRKDADGNIVQFESVKDAAEKMNIQINSIHRACRTGITYKGYYWEYAKGETA